MGKAKMKTKWLQDSSPESLQHPPEKTYWTTFGALLARSSSPQPSTSGFQHGRPKAANQEVNTAQPVRRSSPQPSTSGLHLNRDWRARRSSPHPSTSGLHLNRDWRARRSSPQPSTSAFKRGRKEADQEEQERQRFWSGYYRVQSDTDGSRPTVRFPYCFLPKIVNVNIVCTGYGVGVVEQVFIYTTDGVFLTHSRAVSIRESLSGKSIGHTFLFLPTYIVTAKFKI
ncbi:uncharacterized protein LOC102779518 isoform X1 [Neolamprologus brichardi]|uniref:uncharacterized protein LOC102779518 isoform X1 n=1 Tax=Neolamprologus brichardi TaxID=32507 RepID=UPI0003EC611F|nr:uncharacterized protein LOC102779518 isoform X1 [Neolamprologus brichardi]